MLISKWEKLPIEMQNDEVKPYYLLLRKKNFSLFFKRVFDIFVSSLLLIILSPIFIILSIAIKIDSKGPVFYRQVRITQYKRHYRIFKFRTMVNNADKLGSQVTIKNDSRVTRVGKMIRKCRLDEIPQLLNVLAGTMTFVGTRPEVEKYVNQYTPKMYATLLLPAGVTSETSIYYKDEDKLLDGIENIDDIYIHQILPNKMEYNLKSLKNYGFFKDIIIMFKTVFAIFKK